MIGFVVPPFPQVYYTPLMQESQAPILAPPAPLGQVFIQQSHPNQPAPNNQQGKAKNNQASYRDNNQPQGGGKQPNPPNNVGAN